MNDKNKSIVYIKKLIKLARENKVEWLKVDGVEFKVSAMGLMDLGDMLEGIGKTNRHNKGNDNRGVSNLQHSTPIEDSNISEDEELYYSVD